MGLDLKWLIAVALLALPACADHTHPGALDGSTGDQTLISDLDSAQGETSTSPSGAVNFVVQGCTKVTASMCSGPLPLKLTFSAVLALGGGPTVSWDFGDKSASQPGILVSHTYSDPGTYDVTLSVAEPGGTVSEEKKGFVVIPLAEAGEPCRRDSTCASRRCACASSASGAPACDFPLDSGLCLQVCKGAPCPVRPSGGLGFVCVKLGQGSGSQPRPEWRTDLCLAGCEPGGTCSRAGFACKLSPAGSGWARACVPPGLEEVGAPCRTPGGVLDDSRCLGGACLDMGAAGYCSASCQAGECPEGTRCVQFTGASSKPLCLAQCKGSLGCSKDPLLACEEPSTQGDFGFSVLGASPTKGTRFCAPRRCTADNDCGLAGVCKPAGGGFCRSK